MVSSTSKSYPFHVIFQAGQRVRLTAHAAANGVTLQARAHGKGTVVSQPSALRVLVRPDGYKTTMSFAVSMWEPLP